MGLLFAPLNSLQNSLELSSVKMSPLQMASFFLFAWYARKHGRKCYHHLSLMQGWAFYVHCTASQRNTYVSSSLYIYHYTDQIFKASIHPEILSFSRKYFQNPVVHDFMLFLIPIASKWTDNICYKHWSFRWMFNYIITLIILLRMAYFLHFPKSLKIDSS